MINFRLRPVATEATEKVASMMGVEQLDKLDDTTAIIISRSASGGLNLQTVPLP